MAQWPAPLKAKARQTQSQIDDDYQANRARLIKLLGSKEACVDVGVVAGIVTTDPHICALALDLGFKTPQRNSGDGVTQPRAHGRRSASSKAKPRDDVAGSAEAQLQAEAEDLAILDTVMTASPDSNAEGARAVEDGDLKQFQTYCTNVRAKIMAHLLDGAPVPTGRTLYDLGWYFPSEICQVVHLKNSQAYTDTASQILHELHPEKKLSECRRGLYRGCAFGNYAAALKAYRSRPHSGEMYSKLLPSEPGRENEIPELVMDALRTGQKCMAGHIEEFSEAAAAGIQAELEVAVAGYATGMHVVRMVIESPGRDSDVKYNQPDVLGMLATTMCTGLTNLCSFPKTMTDALVLANNELQECCWLFG